MNNEKGKFIVFEGPGGCGKGIQIEIAKNLLLNNGFNSSGACVNAIAQ